MQIDLILDARAPAAELAELGRQAEALGFGGIWVSSLLDGRDPFANLMPLAQVTNRIRLGPVAVNPWDMHPVRIAAALHTLNEMSAGRARVVIGGGGEALAALGLQPVRRVRAVQECVELIKLAARGQRCDYDGQLYQVQGYQLGWLTAPAPAVWVGANRPQMLRMTGRVADGVMLSDMPPGLAADALAVAHAAAAAHHKGPLRTSAFAAWHVYADRAAARAEGRRWLLLRGLFRPWVLETFLEPAEVELIMRSQAAFAQAFARGADEIEGIPLALADKLVDELTLVGTPDDTARLRAELQRYQQLGLSSLSLRLYEEPARAMEYLAAEIVPGLAASE